MKLRNVMGVLSVSLLAACGGEQSATGGAGEVNVYNWSDYIAEDTNANFQKATGINVVYDVFDSNELLETKLLAGSTGYDVVVPTANFLGKQIEAGVFLPLDRSKLPNFSKLDPAILKKLESQDPGNQYAVPYMWGTTGLGYNVKKVEAIFGNTEVTESLDLLFKPELLSKLKDCGVVVPDSPDELLPVTLNWLGEDPNSLDPEVIRKTVPVLKAIRPFITNFHSSSYIDSLANGDTCLVLGWSGDVVQAAQRAEEAGNGVEIAYSIPKEGSTLWFDMLAIPKDAPHLDAAYAYINYLLDPKVMAENSNYIWYPNAVPESKPLINPEITGDPNIYPTPEVEARLYTSVTLPPEINELYNRIWTEIKTSR